MIDIDFHKGRAADTVMRRLRRLFLRAQPEEREIRILRGILAEVADRLLDRLLADSPRDAELLYLKGLRHLVAGRRSPGTWW